MYLKLRELYAGNPREANLLFLMLAVFLAVYFVPAGTARFDNAVLEAVRLTNWYAREHVVLCLLPAFLIAGAMSTYISQGSVMRYLGPEASKPVAFGVASVSGTLLAVCSCTVLPLFGGIYRRGAGLGAAIAFLYSGPAINVMAVVVTAKVLGAEIGIARALGAIGFALVIATLMHWLYRREESERSAGSTRGFGGEEAEQPLGVTVTFFALMVGILVFANWAAADSAAWMRIYQWKWQITALLGTGFAALLIWRWGWPPAQLAWVALAVVVSALLLPAVPELPFALAIAGVMLIAVQRERDREWAQQSWDFAKQILPLLIGGVFIAGFALGRPGHEGIIPSGWVAAAVGDNSLTSTVIASVLGALMYFSTLTEVPIVEALMGAGMGKGPALALLLAGPALSLPNMLVIRTILGTEKTLVYCVLVVIMATITGFIYGNLW
ncbi:permease [Marinobacterium nitratireducens]|uniref:Permease n=1 Tax=Marinobacterium nitratireducens TaxID=518897 RepID=A0A917Z5Q7_9GAMM|nr:permease [Marinobacterium nitratireducens]GGO75936.1 permease [Marinobacterium nitratireducens]